MTTTVIYGTRVTENSRRLDWPGRPLALLRRLQESDGLGAEAARRLPARDLRSIPPGKPWIDERAGRINLTAFAEHLGQPAVADVDALRDWITKGVKSEHALLPEEVQRRMAGPTRNEAFADAHRPG